MVSRSSRAKPGAAVPAELINTLTEWFGKNARDLPWRRNPTPYRVWVSEVMLQQTRVEVVRGYFRRFMKRFPNVGALAKASEDDVLAAWSGLGYYRRARMLHAAAKQIASDHGGRFPRDAQAIAALPGVGRYTAGAIRSIAFNGPAPIVDGNVERVFARLYAVPQPMKSPAAQRLVWDWALAWVSQAVASGHSPRESNQALMELGATVCTARAPRCISCPLKQLCRAGTAGRAAEFPLSAPRSRSREVHLLFVALGREDGALWLVRRSGGKPSSLLPDGLWELPHVEWPGGDSRQAVHAMEDSLSCGLRAAGAAAVCRHSIMNTRLTLTVQRALATGSPRWPHGQSRWFSPEGALKAPIAAATRKLLSSMARPATLAL